MVQNSVVRGRGRSVKVCQARRGKAGLLAASLRPGGRKEGYQRSVSSHGVGALSRRCAAQKMSAGTLAAARQCRGTVVAGAAAVPTRESSGAGAVLDDGWLMHKLGGTCMGEPDRIKMAAKLAMNERSDSGKNIAVVVSAMGGTPKVTDILLKLVDDAVAKRSSDIKEGLDVLRKKHFAAADELLSAGDDELEVSGFKRVVEEDLNNMQAMLRAVSIVGAPVERLTDFLVGHGELWSARLLAGALKRESPKEHIEWVDARNILVVEEAETTGDVDLCRGETDVRMNAWKSALEERMSKANATGAIVVITGFIAEYPDGSPTTLKRNGSDYTATLFGALLKVSRITIWTDVNGVFSADPRKVKDSVCLDNLTYNEAWEMSYFGARVLHPRTTLPLMKENIPVTIRNFFNMSAPGTEITSRAPACDIDKYGYLTAKELVKGFATIDDISLINVEGTGLVGVPGIASAVFSAVRDAGVNVVMISQASSEHSICFAVSDEEADTAKEAVEQKFMNAMSAGRVLSVSVIRDCSVLAAVGQEMASRHGVSASLFTALASAGINVRAIAQGCTEYNITVIVDRKDSEKALKTVHSRFYLSDTPIDVALIGPGLVGSTLLQQFDEQNDVLHDEFNIDLRVVAIASSKRMIHDEMGVNIKDWKTKFESAKSYDNVLSEVTKKLDQSPVPNKVVIDCTASPIVPNYYLEWMEKGFHVITPNKKANSGDFAYYSKLRQIQRKSYTHYFYEATVGAGLPIMSTLKSLREAGDKVKKIEGIFSGTLSYIFNTITPETKFSEIVTGAKEAGYTEPDPRDDLNGMDVARKVCILARESGLKLEMSDISVDNLVPEELRNTESIEEFMSKLPDYDDDFSKRLVAAADKGCVLRYVGLVDHETKSGTVELREYPMDHAFGTLKGADNIVSFQTSRYTEETPLIVRGPGAGAAVTAGGVFSDLLRLSAYFGAPS